MALTITAVPDIKFVLGESGRVQWYDLQPAAADYTTGGYVCPAALFELGQLIGIDILGTNAAGQLYAMTAVFPAGVVGVAPTPSATVNLVVTLAGVQVAAATDLSAIAWRIAAWGW